MCGITCLFADARDLATLGNDEGQLRSVLHHRGPDGSGVYREDSSLLVHNRLAILDLSDDAAQPFASDTTGDVLLFNGEIYNFRELKQRCGDVAWKSQSDTEVILKLYERLGPAFVHELVGIFAFVLYSPRAGRVLAYRDRLGVKPLYYHHGRGHQAGGRLLLASEIKALLPHLQRPALNRRVFRDFLADGLLCHDDETFFEGVRSLPAGHVLEYDLAGGPCEIRPYWTLEPAGEARPTGDAFDQVSALLTDAVRLNLVSDVEVAVSLSSGLDSTLLYALLREQGQDQMRAFTFGYEHGDYDEIRRVRGNRALADVDPISTTLAPSQMLALLDEAIGFYETPLGGLGSLSAYHMMQTVADHGIKVILAGEGADEVFGGYQYYYAPFLASLRDAPERLQRELAGYNRAHGTAITFPSPEFERLVASGSAPGPLAPDGTRLDSHRYVTEELSGIESASTQRASAWPDALHGAMYADLTAKKLPKLLHFQDRAGSAHGVECRVPYLDHRLVELVYALPADTKIREGRNKFLAREVLARRFGIALHQETKHYVATPQREWLKGPLYAPCRELLRDGALRASGLVELERFFGDYEAYRASTELGNSFFAWKLLNLELLMRRWFA